MPKQPPAAPDDTYYVVPPDLKADRLHYVVVQVSERRAVVAKWDGHAYGHHPDGLHSVPSFVVVTPPMTSGKAAQEATKLTRERLARKEGNP